MIEYQIVLKYKSDKREEVVGRTYSRDEATNLRDYYNEQEDNSNILLPCEITRSRPTLRKT